MKRIYSITALLLLFTASLFAQNDAKAESILYQTAAAYRAAGAIKVTFEGTQSGTLILKGNKFYLQCGGVESWFDGRTQWSYVKQNQEVNVSTPTAEEVQSINPYSLINNYKLGFNYRYAGSTIRQGRRGEEVVLTPKYSHDIRSIVLHVDGRYQPDYLYITLGTGQRQEIIVRSCLTNQPINDNFFRFDPRKYPKAEVIDMR